VCCSAVCSLLSSVALIRYVIASRSRRKTSRCAKLRQGVGIISISTSDSLQLLSLVWQPGVQLNGSCRLGFWFGIAAFSSCANQSALVVVMDLMWLLALSLSNEVASPSWISNILNLGLADLPRSDLSLHIEYTLIGCHRDED
jgi:hypothetical protein